MVGDSGGGREDGERKRKKSGGLKRGGVPRFKGFIGIEHREHSGKKGGRKETDGLLKPSRLIRGRQERGYRVSGFLGGSSRLGNPKNKKDEGERETQNREKSTTKCRSKKGHEWGPKKWGDGGSSNGRADG